MKTLLTTVLCFLISFVQAQKTLQVTYTTGAPHLNLQNEVYLFISDNISEYLCPIEARTWVTPQGFQAELSHNYYSIFFKADDSRHIIRTLEDGTRIHTPQNPEPLPWQLTKETKEILGYSCQKAILPNEFGFTDQDSGDIIAWFTPEIEAPLGPNRYTGLPGLILEISYTLDSGYRTLVTEIKQVEREVRMPDDMGFAVSEDDIWRSWSRREIRQLKKAGKGD
ncbi:MAG: GLPGLI family protein [Nitritalea sp.]